MGEESVRSMERSIWSHGVQLVVCFQQEGKKSTEEEKSGSEPMYILTSGAISLALC